MNHYLVLYDISDPKRLRHVAKTMEKYGRRVQYSGFEIRGGRALIKRLKKEILNLIDPDEDGVAWIALCEEDWAKREYFASFGSSVQDDADYRIV